MQNYNPKIKKVQQLVILSKTKNLGCDAVSSVLWPDSSAAPQDDRKIGPFGWNQRRNAMFNIRFQFIHFVPLLLCALVPYFPAASGIYSCSFVANFKKQSQFAGL